MGCGYPSARNPGDNHPDDLLAKLSGLINLRLRVRPDLDLGCIEIVLLASDTSRSSITLTPIGATDLALHLVAAVGKLRGWENAP